MDRDALTLYRRTVHIDPNNAKAFACQANSLFELERFDAAGAAYRIAIGLDAGYQQTYTQRRDILIEQVKTLNQQGYALNVASPSQTKQSIEQKTTWLYKEPFRYD